MTQLPQDTKTRKGIPLARGLLDYFPNALAKVAEVSKAGNDKHNPGEEMHHARGKSMDHADCILRHLVDRGSVDPEDGLRHSAKVAWRALALLQEELEQEEGVPLPRAAKVVKDPVRSFRRDLQKCIAGQVRTSVYNEYYGFDPDEQVGTCEYCGQMLMRKHDIIEVEDTEGVFRMYCSITCMEADGGLFDG